MQGSTTPDSPYNTTAVPAPPRPLAPPPPPFALPPLPRVPRIRTRPMQFLLFVAAMLWYLGARTLAASASRGLVFRFDMGDVQPLLEAVFTCFLVVLGFAFLRKIERRLAPLNMALGLPPRRTQGSEWATGAALGWGIAVAMVIPIAIFGSLRVHLWTTPRAFLLLCVSLATLAVATLAHALGVYGYGFQRLIDALGAVRATIVIALLSAIYMGFNQNVYMGFNQNVIANQSTAVMGAMLASLLMSIAWLRTHGLWLVWGMHFASLVALGVVFGLPLGGSTDFNTVVETRAVGHAWLTGGSFGPTAGVFTILVLLAAIPVLVRITSDFAWEYTRPPLIPGGYDVTIPPPAAHVVMEREAQQVSAAQLVQIMPSAPPPLKD